MSTPDNDQHGGSEDTISNTKTSTSCEQNNNNIDVIDGINSVVILGSKCAECGKESGDSMNTCNKCKMVKYCNAACKKKHRKKHKKACEKRVAELHDEALFKEPPPPEDCPICMLPMPRVDRIVFQSCCGKDICQGCMVSIVDQQRKEKKALVLEEQLCAYCRTPAMPTKEIKRTKKLMEAGNASAFNYLAGLYSTGMHGLPRDMTKACELWLKAGELGCAVSYLCLGNHYRDGNGVELDKKKMVHFYELAAIGGDLDARHNLGVLDWERAIINQDMDEKKAMYYCDRAVKHFLLAARAGFKNSLNNLTHIFKHGGGEVTKDEYTNAMRAYQESHDGMKSGARDKAAALNHTMDGDNSHSYRQE